MGRNIKIHFTTWIALAFILSSLLFVVFRDFEPIIYPVVKDFRIEDSEYIGDSLIISGSFIKSRSDCVFKDVIAYNGRRFIGITFMNTPDRKTVNRLPGSQTYGPWRLRPATDYISIYSTHDCITGTVITLLYSDEVQKGRNGQ